MTDTQTVRRTPYPPAAPSEPVEPLAVVVHDGLVRQTASVGGLYAFADPDALEAAFLTTGWTIQEEIKLLVDIAQDVMIAPSIRIKAAEALHARAIKAMILRGDIISVRSRETSEDGSLTVEKMGHIVRQSRVALERVSAPDPIKEIASDADPNSEAESEVDLEAGPDAESEGETSDSGGTDDPAGRFHQPPRSEAAHRGLASAPTDSLDSDPGGGGADVVQADSEAGLGTRPPERDGPEGPPTDDPLAEPAADARPDRPDGADGEAGAGVRPEVDDRGSPIVRP